MRLFFISHYHMLYSNKIKLEKKMRCVKFPIDISFVFKEARQETNPLLFILLFSCLCGVMQ